MEEKTFGIGYEKQLTWKKISVDSQRGKITHHSPGQTT